MFLAAAWLLGDSVDTRRAYMHELEEKAERLEREHEAQARRVAAEERARIARELHDVVCARSCRDRGSSRRGRGRVRG